MLSLLKLSIKWFIISLCILTLGNWIHWNGSSLSEIVKITMAPLEKQQNLVAVQKWAKDLTQDAQKGIMNKIGDRIPASMRPAPEDEVSVSERQKLKALINQLNSPEPDPE